MHISQALAPIGKLLGYDVTIVDPRTAFATPERFPDVKVIAEWPDKALPPLNVDRYTAFVALTHDPKIDDPALLHALSRDCFYIGALGSRKTHARRLERLKQQGLSDADLARIHAPIGLDIGAVSPAEIAVAIMAQITERLREEPARRPPAGQGRVMKFGAVAPKEAIGGTAVHTIRQGALVLKKGTLIGPAEVAALEAAGIKDIVVARLEPDDVSEDVAAADIADGDRRRGRACRSRLHRPRQSVRANCRRAGRRQGRDRPPQPRRRGDHVGDAAGLQAGRRRRDDRDRQDHSVRGGRGRPRQGAGGGARRRWCASRPIASARSASSRRCCPASPPR